ncbi:MAG TPA: shikimate dehydrogenase [Solirubrobacterales bacterium]|nr:shikimate dehydrogenase [Solirubrobacterales bacterium]
MLNKRLAVLGHPVAHSRSPAMQNAALEDLGLSGEWHYEAIDVPVEEIDEFIAGMAGEGFAGANVTVPHKHAALAAADRATPAAREIGAANTLTFGPEGIVADNTDAPGLLDALGESPSGRKALLLGAGGAARAVLWALNGAGARTSVWNRTESRAAELVRDLGGELDRSPDASEFDLIVNASAAGLGGEDGIADLPIDPDLLRSGQTVVDMVYGDRPSSLLLAATEAGAVTVDGLEILVRQGALSLRSWTGREPSLDVMRRAARG